MSLQVTCRCQVADLHQTVLDRALVELRQKYSHLTGYSRVSFVLQNGEIAVTYDNECHSRSSIQNAINTTLVKHKEQFRKEENKRKKMALAKALKKSGFNVQIQRLGYNKLLIRGTR